MYGLAIFDIQTHKEIMAICTLDKSDPLNQIPFSNMTRGEKLRRTFSVRQSRCGVAPSQSYYHMLKLLTCGKT